MFFFQLQSLDASCPAAVSSSSLVLMLVKFCAWGAHGVIMGKMEAIARVLCAVFSAVLPAGNRGLV